MMATHSSGDHVRVLREAAERTVARLGLSGFDNASIAAADAWIDSDEFRAHWAGGSVAPAYDVAAYLGEAIIRRHGGKWSFDGNTPCVAINRNGQHFVQPFTKVQKRAVNGREEHLLGLVHLVEHVTTKPKLDAEAVFRDAEQALALGVARSGEMSATRALGLLLLALIGFPLVVLGGLALVTDPTYALIGGACAVPVGFVLLFVLAGERKKRAPLLSPLTLAWEAQLTIDPLEQRLAEKMMALGAQPSQDRLAEVAFYAAQLRELHAIVASRDPSPGRGYVGFDTYASNRTSTWRRPFQFAA